MLYIQLPIILQLSPTLSFAIASKPLPHTMQCRTSRNPHSAVLSSSPSLSPLQSHLSVAHYAIYLCTSPLPPISILPYLISCLSQHSHLIPPFHSLLAIRARLSSISLRELARRARSGTRRSVESRAHARALARTFHSFAFAVRFILPASLVIRRCLTSRSLSQITQCASHNRRLSPATLSRAAYVSASSFTSPPNVSPWWRLLHWPRSAPSAPFAAPASGRFHHRLFVFAIAAGFAVAT